MRNFLSIIRAYMRIKTIKKTTPNTNKKQFKAI